MDPNSQHPLPNSVIIPRGLIDRWVAIDQNDFVALKITRGDLDKFYAAFDNMARAQAVFQDAMIVHSNGNLDEANKLNTESRRLLIEGQNAFRLFFTAIMSTAEGSNP